MKQCVSVPKQCVGGVCDRCRMEKVDQARKSPRRTGGSGMTYTIPESGSYNVHACCPNCSSVMSARVDAPDNLYVELLELKCEAQEEQKAFFEERLTYLRDEETELRQALEQIVNESFENGESISRAIANKALEIKE